MVFPSFINVHFFKCPDICTTFPLDLSDLTPPVTPPPPRKCFYAHEWKRKWHFSASFVTHQSLIVCVMERKALRGSRESKLEALLYWEWTKRSEDEHICLCVGFFFVSLCVHVNRGYVRVQGEKVGDRCAGFVQWQVLLQLGKAGRTRQSCVSEGEKVKTLIFPWKKALSEAASTSNQGGWHLPQLVNRGQTWNVTHIGVRLKNNQCNYEIRCGKTYCM